MAKDFFPPAAAELHFPVPEHAILARLGYSRFRTEIAGNEMRQLQREISHLARLCRPRGAWTVIAVESAGNSGIRLAGNQVIASAKVASRYTGARRIWFGAATIGPELPQLAAQAMQEKRMRDAVVADAVGSECADAAMDFLQKNAAAALLRYNMQLAEFRFSPGYGDWSLTGQQLFFDFLNMDELGVTLLPGSNLLQPEKTVTAVAGVLCG